MFKINAVNNNQLIRNKKRQYTLPETEDPYFEFSFSTCLVYCPSDIFLKFFILLISLWAVIIGLSEAPKTALTTSMINLCLVRVLVDGFWLLDRCRPIYPVLQGNFRVVENGQENHLRQHQVHPDLDLVGPILALNSPAINQNIIINTTTKSSSRTIERFAFYIMQRRLNILM